MAVVVIGGCSEGKVLTIHKIARRGENDRWDGPKWRLAGVWDKQSKKIVSVGLQMAQFRLLFSCVFLEGWPSGRRETQTMTLGTDE